MLNTMIPLSGPPPRRGSLQLSAVRADPHICVRAIERMLRPYHSANGCGYVDLIDIFCEDKSTS